MFMDEASLDTLQIGISYRIVYITVNRQQNTFWANTLQNLAPMQCEDNTPQEKRSGEANTQTVLP